MDHVTKTPITDPPKLQQLLSKTWKKEYVERQKYNHRELQKDFFETTALGVFVWIRIRNNFSDFEKLFHVRIRYVRKT